MKFLTKIVRAVALCASLVACQSSDPVVNLGYAQYRGVTNASIGVTSYYGIRYAQPPIGDLRWQPPMDIESRNTYNPSTVMNATSHGPICVQGTPDWALANGSMLTAPLGDEDCLLLDVSVPRTPASSNLPVMVQIHGGGYTLGSSSSYPGYSLLNQSAGGLIYVAIQYRLSAFGFLSSTEIRENGIANAGLLDQRAALAWVQRNIRSFGGDPSKVTIIGGSAGGGSVMNQMILYGGVANPPFRAVVAEYPWWQPYHNNTVLEDQYRELLAATNCTNLQCLRSIDAAVLHLASQATYIAGYMAQPGMNYGYGDFYYGPSVDGNIIRDLPSNEFKQGHFTKVPLLVDREGYEGAGFSNKSETTKAEETADFQTLFPYAKQSFFDRLYELYPASSFNATFWQRQSIFGDFIINCPTYYMSTAVSDWGLPVWKMIFNAGSQFHGATVPFIFETNATLNNNATLALIMKDYFISFAVNLDPNSVSYSATPKPYWPAYQVGSSMNFTVMDVNYTMMGVVGDFDASAQCDYFHGQSYAVRN
ncbi:hypothetical protein LTR66_004013 [Elasticomyces elasticus]|nr:hypothetical protein LTR66_004013 [Elasticomyces elasticus]